MVASGRKPQEPGRTRGRAGRGLWIAIHRAAVLGLLVAGTACSTFAAYWAVAQSQALWRLSPLEYRALVGALLLSAATGVVVTVRQARGLRRKTWVSTSLAPFRAGLYLLVGGTAAYLIWLQPFKAYTLALFWGVGAGVFALLIGFGGRLAAALPRRLVRVLDRSLLLLCLLVLSAEGGLRLLAAARPRPLLASEDMSVAGFLASNRLPPGHVHLGHPCDARGYYDEEPAGNEPLVAVIGDSFGVGVVPHYFHYTTVAERALDGAVQVYNAGVAAAGPAEYARMLAEDVLPLRPRVVVVALFVGNDVAEARRFRREYPLLRQWFDRGNVLTWLVPSRLWRLAGERGRSGGEAVGLAPGSGGTGLLPQDEASLLARFPWLGDPELERGSLSAETFLAVEADRCRHVCDPADQRDYASLFAALEELRDLAGGVPLAFLLIPDQLQVDDTLWPRVCARLGRDDLDRDQPQRLIGGWLRDRDLPFLDLLPELRAVAPLPDGMRHVYHRRDTHWNRRGNEVAGAALARFLGRWLR